MDRSLRNTDLDAGEQVLQPAHVAILLRATCELVQSELFLLLVYQEARRLLLAKALSAAPE